MSSAAHYHFAADIYFHNASETAMRKVHDICDKIYKDKRNKRRSNKYWTDCKITDFRAANANVLDSMIRFEIEDAETVRELDRIEDELKVACSANDIRRVITSIDCRHTRTK